MKGIRKLFPLVVVDIIGGFAVLLAVLCLFFGDSGSWEHSDSIDFCSNLSVEIIGIWIAVRAIDAILQKRQRIYNARIGLVRNVRFLTSLSLRVAQHLDRLDLHQLQHEYEWATGIFEKRKKYLSHDEQQDLENFYLNVNAIRQEATRLQQLKEELDWRDDSDYGEFDREKEVLKKTVAQIEELGMKAQSNILEETEET